MASLILPFAETLSDNDANLDDTMSFTTIKQEDFLNSNFPSLFSAVPSSNDRKLVYGNKDTTPEDITVRINGRPYAEVALKAGVHHDPIIINNSCTATNQKKRDPRQHDKVQRHPHTFSLSALNSYYTTNENDVDFDEEDPWYQIKCGRSRKHETNSIIRQRRQRTLEKAFQQATSEYFASPKHKHQQQSAPTLNTSQNPCRHLDEYKDIKECIPESYYQVRRRRTMSWMTSYAQDTRHSKIDRFSTKDAEINLIKQQTKNHPFAKRIFLDALLERYGYQSSMQALDSMNDPKLDYSDIEHIARNYRNSYDYKTILSYETNIIPGLKEEYHRVLRKHIQALSGMLPSPKDKSVCRISRTQYARAVLLLIEINK